MAALNQRFMVLDECLRIFGFDEEMFKKARDAVDLQVKIEAA